MTWSVRYHVLSLEYLCLIITNRFSFRIECSARCIIKCWFCSFSLLNVGLALLNAVLFHVQQWFHWRICIFGGTWTFCLFINWATCFKILRTPDLRWTSMCVEYASRTGNIWGKSCIRRMLDKLRRVKLDVISSKKFSENCHLTSNN